MPIPTAPQVVEIFYCQLAAEFKVSPEDALVTVDGVPIGRADNSDRARQETRYVFSRPGRHDVKLAAPGDRTTWIAVVVDPKATEETAEVDTRLPQG